MKNFKLSAEEIKLIIPHSKGCFATDKITVEGRKVGYMYREQPYNEFDSGWRFFSGTEDQDYVDNAENTMIYKLNTIANYDKAIIPYLDCLVGASFERIEGTDNFNQIIE